MSDLNVVVLSGRLTRDPELRYTQGGQSVMDIGLASNRVWKKDGQKKEDTLFVDLTLWGKQAEVMSDMLSKGRYVMITGRLRFNQWESSEGTKRSKLTIDVDKIDLTPDGNYQSQSGDNDKEPEVDFEESGANADVPF